MNPKEFELTLISLLTAAISEDETVLDTLIESIDTESFVKTWAKMIVQSWSVTNQDMIVEMAGLADEDLSSVLQEAALYVATADEDDFGFK